MAKLPQIGGKYWSYNWEDDKTKWVKDNLGDSLCGAKWYNATIWLGSGMTTSCHHPQAHQIDVDELKANPSALHNTPYKKLVRKQMQEGIRPKECEYCWKIEDLGPTNVSDRFHKSSIYSSEDLKQAFDSDFQENIELKTLEVSFDSNCNFACSYCNASFSTTWAHDINTKGAYQDLVSDVGYTYAQNGNWTRPYGVKNEGNPYLEAFWKWWEDKLQHNLMELRVTGGDATVSPGFWKLMEWYKQNSDCNVRLAVNTNLGNKAKVNDLIEYSKYVKDFHMFTSNESMGANAEYIRDGLIWDEWKENLINCIEKGNFKLIHVMLTVNALCLASLPEFLEFIFGLDQKYKDTKIEVSFNILRFPSFQSITTLPDHLRQQKADQLAAWLEENEHLCQHFWVVNRIQAVIDYTRNVADGHIRASDIEKRVADFKSFFQQYDARRGKDITESFANWPEFVTWWKSLTEVQKNPTDLHNELIPPHPYEDEVFEWYNRQ